MVSASRAVCLAFVVSCLVVRPAAAPAAAELVLLTTGRIDLPLVIGTLFFLYSFKHIWPNLEATFGWGPFFIVMLVAGGAMFIPLLSLARLVRRLLGIPDPPDADTGLWRAADQLHYSAGERVDRFQGRWRPDPETDWPGADAGRGQRHESDWRGRNG